MSRNFFVSVAAFAAVTGLGAASVSASITIPTVPIGNPGNAADPSTGGLYGAVAYSYNIGTTEVTNAQYAAFLNAVGATDSFDLYNMSMAGAFGGITRSGSAGSYTYATVNGRADNPVNFVSFWDATRFANWLHNGQPMGMQDNATTDDGAYTLTRDGIVDNLITRNTNWQWAVTSENEWYKAAYHQPVSAGGDADDYWFYTTSSNIAPTTAEANFGGSIGNTAPVGSYAANFYGAFDMGGNVWEFNESIVVGSLRAIRGGGLSGPVSNLDADSRLGTMPTNESQGVGFRVSQVPGPSSVALVAIGGVMVGRRRRG
jgi:formylglycine-generating enzyme